MYGTNFVFFGRIYEKNYGKRGRVYSDSGLASVTAGCSLSDGAHDLKRRRRSVVVYLPSTNTITLVVATTSRHLHYALRLHFSEAIRVYKSWMVEVCSVPLCPLSALAFSTRLQNLNAKTKSRFKIFLLLTYIIKEIIRNAIASTNRYDDCSNRPSEHSASQPATAIHYCLSL